MSGPNLQHYNQQSAPQSADFDLQQYIGSLSDPGVLCDTALTEGLCFKQSFDGSYAAEPVPTQPEAIEALISRAIQLPSVILPASNVELAIAQNRGATQTTAFEKPKARQPRLKTILSLLETDFGVTLTDENQIQLFTGPVDDQVLRETSYHITDVPAIDRTILSCDEVGNATFVFDRSLLKEVPIKPLGLAELSKDQLADLLEQTPKLGHRFRYSEKYADNMTEALLDPGAAAEAYRKRQGPSSLAPKAAADELSIGAYATSRHVRHDVIVNFLKGLDIVLEDRLFHARTVPALPLEVQALLDKHPQIATPRADPKDVSLKVYSLSRSSSPGTFYKMLEELEISLPRKKFNGAIADAVTPEMRDYLDTIPVKRAMQRFTKSNNPSRAAKPVKQTSEIEPGELTLQAFADERKVDLTTVKKLLLMAGVRPIERKNIGNTSKVVSSEMQKWLGGMPAFKIELATDQISLSTFARQHTRDYKTTVAKAKKLGFEPVTRKFGRHNALSISPDETAQLAALPFFASRVD